MTSQADGVRLPKRSDLKKKHDAIRKLKDRPMTNVRDQIPDHSQTHPT
jgi:RNA polymerase-associated protein RTF1